jgi:energy-coupling factor transport system substrate-specific component
MSDATIARVSHNRTARAVPIGARSAIAIGFTTAIGIVAFGWPFLAAPESSVLAHASDAPIAFALLVPAVLIVVLAQFADGAMDAKSVAMLGVLTAVVAALRPLGAGVAGIEPIWAIIILGAYALGPGFGFVLGAVSLFASALITGGIGPWLPFQMLAAAWIGLAAGLVAATPTARRWRGSHPWREVIALAAFACLAAIAYGMLMNLWFWPFTIDLAPGLAFVPGEPVTNNVLSWLRFSLVTSLGFDIPRAILATALIAVAGRPILVALRRASRRAAFEAPIRFESSQD